MAAEAEPAKPDAPKKESAGGEKKSQRKIPGNFSYTPTPGKLKEALENLVRAERPDKFGRTFVETVLGIKGGSAAPVTPILKRVGFVTSDGTPTDLYAKFQSEGGRGQAALEGLRNGFGELFKRNTYAHKLDENGLKDTLVEITGLKRTDPVIQCIYGTFDAFRGFIKGDVQVEQRAEQEPEAAGGVGNGGSRGIVRNASLGLSYQINIVLPETTDISVFNAIFRSLRENLLPAEYE
jgi:hypothetical protein